MADKKDQKEIIPSTLTELALMLLFGFMLTAAHFAKEAAGLQARAEDAESKLRSVAAPSCGFLDPANTRPAVILLFVKQTDGNYAVRINNEYARIERNGMNRTLPDAIKRRFNRWSIVPTVDLASTFNSLELIDRTAAGACTFAASIGHLNQTPQEIEKIFTWTAFDPKDKPPGSL